MGFFDLNIPYEEHSSSSSSRANRIKIVAKIMELGYSGIAYNRTIKGVMSEQDRCSIPLLNVSSLHSILPSFSASVEFHRDLLGVPRSSPFRQYTRLTICVSSQSEVLAVNSGNLILKTYDLIAVRPLNQYAFDQACEKLEIDIIAIDFAEKLPFRLKLGLIKSAIQRGVYFEITYSDLLLDVHERRQMISTTKFLVDWTKGKNLIISSHASSVNEIRGPYDVANLTSLLGVSMERGKTAVSKNCRNLIANALKRKQFYKETIRVERISSSDKLDLNDPWSVDLFKWDPISSGEGDLLLDDIAKCFAVSNKEPKNVKAIDFTSVIDNMPPQGFLVSNVISGSEAKLSPTDNRGLLHVADVIEPPIGVTGVIQQSHPLDGEHCSASDRQCSVIESFKILHSQGDAGKVSSNSEEDKSTVEIVQTKTSIQEEPIEMDIDNVQPQNPLSSSELHVASTNELVHSPTSSRDVLTVVCGNDGKETFKMSEDVDSSQIEYGLKSSDILSGSENVLRDKSPTNLVSENQKNMTVVIDGDSSQNEYGFEMSEDVDSPRIEYVLKSSDILSGSENVLRDKSPTNLVSENQNNMIMVIDDDSPQNEYGFKLSEDVDSPQIEYGLKSSDILSGSENVLRDKSPTNLVSENQNNMTMVIDGTFTAEECLPAARLGEPGDVAVLEDQVSPLRSCHTGDINDDFLIAIRQQTSEVLMEEQNRGEADPQITRPPLDQSTSGVMSTVNAGKYPAKRRRPHPALKLPLKRLINPLAFKKVRKTNADKYRSKRRRLHPALLLPFKRLINPLAFKKKKRPSQRSLSSLFSRMNNQPIGPPGSNCRLGIS